ncbi:MAG: glycine--tRNA ligase subunit beta [Alphaproteobacteria bacterium]|nr:glycine--tRNA ligase subunit beta [Alphaproteobacteria bacterium]
MSANKFLLEIGIEEIPAQYVQKMAQSLEVNIQKALVENNIEHQNACVYYTPRRLVLLVEQMSDVIAGTVQEVKGPAKKSAFDEQNNPTRALQGFLAGRKLTLEDTFIKNINGVEYIFANQKTEAKNTADVMATLLPNLIMSIYQPNPMRWNTFSGKFIRPIRWILCLLGTTPVNFELEFVKSGNTTRGHRTLANHEIAVTSVDDYLAKLPQAFVLLNQNERKQIILEQIKRLEKQYAITVPIDTDLLDEIVNLVEYPTAAVGSYDSAFLALPEPIIITPMKDHQRYFPAYQNGKLTDKFVFVRNGNDYCIENVIKGNQRVLSARLKDGEFFYQEDLKTSLADKAKKLPDVVFQTKLGSYTEKMARVQEISYRLNLALNLNLSDKIDTTIPLLKADLVSAVVGEFSEIQGVMGAIYARHDGYAEDVCQAIEEQYLPRFSGDKLPQSNLGAVVAIADKLDSIMGLCAVNLKPTGSQDPFALRRQAIGILATIKAHNFDLNLSTFIKSLAPLYAKFYEAENMPESDFTEYVCNFFAQRLSIMLNEDMGFAISEVISKIDLSTLNMSEIVKKAEAISKLNGTSHFEEMIQVMQRIDKMIAGKSAAENIVADLVKNADEKIMMSAFYGCQEYAQMALNNADYEVFVENIYSCLESINAFFDHNLVMSEDLNERANRMAELKLISDFMHKFVL